MDRNLLLVALMNEAELRHRILVSLLSQPCTASLEIQKQKQKQKLCKALFFDVRVQFDSI